MEFLCDQCEKAFEVPERDVRTAFVVYDGVRSFLCPECLQMKGEVKCPNCDSLNDPVYYRNGKPGYTCSFCGTTY